MKIEETQLKGVYVLTPDVFGDNRGYFMETYSKNKIKEIFDGEFVQDNHSYSKEKGVIRGLHCQTRPYAQTKLLRCTSGEIYDVVVDIRKGSPTYKQWIKVKLTEENKKQIFIPKGCLHGFVTLTPDVEVQYKVDEFYNKECDRSVKYDDPEFGVEWDETAPIVSKKDELAPLYKDSDCDFTYGE